MPPPGPEPRLATEKDHQACRTLIRGGSKTFSAASLLLPAKVRRAAYALYGFCRLSDDLVDVEGGSPEAIARLRRRLDLAYAGRPEDNAIDRAFADVVAQYAVPRVLPEALIEGLEWDVSGVVCEDIEDLYAYAARVAGSVGAMMSVVMGVTDSVAVARACDLGVAMQLTNIARDVGEDARAGRLYLPRNWMRAEGLDPESWLAQPDFNPAIARTVGALLNVAEALYARADFGIAQLPGSCRAGIFAARHLYREIGIEVLRRRCDSVSSRARVSSLRKLALVGRSIVDTASRARPAANTADMAATAYLVRATTVSPPRSAKRSLRSRESLPERIVWVAELFAALDHRERMSRQSQ